MKVIETTRDERTGEVTEASWGNVIEDDLAVIQSVVNILRHQRDRDAGKVHTAVGRFTTTSIRIEL